MVKETPSPLRIAAMVLFTTSVVMLLLFLWLSFGGSIPLRPESYRFEVTFPEAQTLAQEADVRLAGVNVGKVKKKELNKGADGTLVTIELKKQYAPIAKDTRAVLRQKTLLGETYVELAPGKASSGDLSDGGTLSAAQVEPTVELDEIFNTFDKPTRDAFQSWVKELSVAIRGRGAGDLNAALGNLGPFADGRFGVVEDVGRAGRGGESSGEEHGGGVRGDQSASGCFARVDREWEQHVRGDGFAGSGFGGDDSGVPDVLGRVEGDAGAVGGVCAGDASVGQSAQAGGGGSWSGGAGSGGSVAGSGGVVQGSAGVGAGWEEGFAGVDECGVGVRASVRGCARVPARAQPDPVRVQLPAAGHRALSLGRKRRIWRERSAASATRPRSRCSTRTGCSRATRRNSPSTRGNSYMQPNGLLRGPALGIVSESFHCPGGKEQKDPIDAEKLPPCFVAPPSLLTGKQFIHLGKGKAPYRKPPQGLEGTAPANPGR